MKLLVDMNLSPLWAPFLTQAGWETAHWSSLGNPRATDAEIMSIAREQHWVVFTHDLDFGALLAHTHSPAHRAYSRFAPETFHLNISATWPFAR